MSEITKPIALDETLQRVAAATERIADKMTVFGELIVVETFVQDAPEGLTNVGVMVKDADTHETLYDVRVPISGVHVIGYVEPDVHYYLAMETLEGYSHIAPQYHVAVNGYQRNIEATYHKYTSGVYIRLIDGTDVIPDEGHFVAGMKAMGVSVSDGEIGFVIALNGSPKQLTWALANTKEATEFLGHCEEEGKADTNTQSDGQGNCAEILDGLSAVGNAPAIEYCHDFVWPDGRSGIGYLPSIGELRLAGANVDNINTALNLIAGATPYTITSNNWWSSSQGSTTTAWYLGSNNPLSFGGRNTYAYVRAFSAF